MIHMLCRHNLVESPATDKGGVVNTRQENDETDKEAEKGKVQGRAMLQQAFWDAID